MKAKHRYLTVDELIYLARVPKTLALEILRTPSAQRHLVEIDTFNGWGKDRQQDYLLAKHRLHEAIADTTKYENRLIDLSGLQLDCLPPEIHHVVRRARRFRLDLSGNHFTHYYLIRRAITRDLPDHPIPFDAINLDGNPLEDLPAEIIERGKRSAHYLEECWLRRWAKPYNLAQKVTDTMEAQRFTEGDVVNALKLMLHLTGTGRDHELHRAPRRISNADEDTRDAPMVRRQSA